MTSAGSTVTTVVSPAAVALTATVKAGATAITTGQVKFCDATATYCTDIHILGTAQLTSAGTATFRFVPAIGTHNYKAVFVGTNAYSASSSSTSALSVTGVHTSATTVTSSGSAGNYTLNAIVTGVGSPALAPTGQVTFLDQTNSGYSLATASLASGIYGFGMAGAPNPTALGATVATGDFNNDGIPDIAVGGGGGSPSTLTTLLGNGDGTFKALPTVNTLPNGYVGTIVVGDFDSDGIPDLAILGTTGVAVLHGNADGTFSIASTPLAGTTLAGIALGDWNGDGILDIAVSDYKTDNVTLLLGNGDGTFTTGSGITTAGGANYLASGDFNGDGRLDLAVLVISPTSYNIVVYLGNGDGTFTIVPGNPAVASFDIEAFAIADVDGDGAADIVVPNTIFNNASIYLGHGNGTFSTGASSPNTGNYPTGIATGDFNGDGKPDFVLTNGNSNSTVGPVLLLGNGDGTFTLSGPFTGNYSFAAPTVADFNGDGDSDFVYVLGYSSAGTAPLSVLLTQAGLTATASAPSISPVGTGTHQVAASYAGDSNFNPSTSSTIGLTAQPVATALTLTANPTTIAYSQLAVLTAVLSPYTAQGQTTNGESIAFFSGGASLGTATLFSGVASLNATSLHAGTDSLTATYTHDTNFAGATSNNLSYVVSQGTPVIVWSPPASAIYTGKAIGAGELSATSTTPGTFAYTATLAGGSPVTISAANVLSVGTYTLTTTLNPTDSTDYKSVSSTATFTVTPAPLTVVPSNSTRAYGAANPTLTGTVTGALNSDVFTITGSTTATATSPVGTYPITYAVSGANLANYSVTSATGTLTVTQATPTMGLTASPNPVLVQNPVTLTATVASSAGTPSGSVVFSDSGTTLGMANLSGGIAAITISTLAVGPHSLTAAYSGDTNFSAAAGASPPEVIDDFTLTMGTSGSSQTVQPGGTATYTLPVTLTSGTTLPLALNFSTSGVPVGFTPTFTPPSLAAGSALATVILTIQVPQTAALERNMPPGGGLTAVALGMILLPFTGRIRRTKSWLGRLAILALLLTAVGGTVMVTGCGGGGGGRQPQTYNFTVTATSGPLSHSTPLTLIVQ